MNWCPCINLRDSNFASSVMKYPRMNEQPALTHATRPYTVSGSQFSICTNYWPAGKQDGPLASHALTCEEGLLASSEVMKQNSE